ncbi:carbohydrate ABC transporter permease [Truepera radiovictrix]|uniref:Binding-protein-dependent transport systems inner membrane component n=1 Tax=Truepera radiovictrix (strain DSM 17093 / CIP 108686 / LMG 22925 / RQ-24) TaxID=649638 RepID=D7CRW7_TRURR|nr:sugar ABC transporter permease [Truepera radiovictrix]ADI15295.1 binding-protein-dependent transport systems inner membrane component [Truepera radiovictrix DSM 17093]WMT56154.1 sugar ABC transporter permease [Truepera radiovictrix]
MKRAADFFDRHAPWLFPLPALLAILVLIVGPILANFVLATYDFFIGSAPRFVGLANFETALADRRFWNGLVNTFYFTGVAVPLQMLLGLGIALLFNRDMIGKGFVRTLILLPMVATPVAIALIWALMFNPSLGVLNYFLESLGLPRSLWVADARLAIPSLVLVDVWQWSPFVALILLAALQGVPQEYYEAARIDGAGAWQSFWHITLPGIRAAIVVALILRSIDALKTFDIIYVITQGGPGTASETLNVFAFKTGFEFFRAGYAATLLIFLLFVVLGIAVLLNLARRRVA